MARMGRDLPQKTEGVGLIPAAICLRLELRSHPTGMFQHRLRRNGGRGGIRTHGWFNPTLDFESSALNRTQPPFLKAKIYPIRLPSEISNFKSEIFFSRTLY